MKKIIDIISENDCKEYAENVSKSVVLSGVEDGVSFDVREEAKASQKEIVFIAVYSALLSIRNSYCKEESDLLNIIFHIKSMAEFVVISKFSNMPENVYNKKHINTFLSVYIPIDEFLKEKGII